MPNQSNKNPYLIDSHAHLSFQAYGSNRREVIDEALEQKIWFIGIGSNFQTSRQAVELAQDYSLGVYASIGVHPIHVYNEDFDRDCLLDLARNNEKVVAIGETGLDYYHIFNHAGKLKQSNLKPEVIKGKQKQVFSNHLDLARLLNLPLILHCRSHLDNDAHQDLLEMLTQYKARYNDFDLRGVIHCYTGGIAIAKRYLELGFYLGFTGIITYSQSYDKLLKFLPMERILIETDSPFLTPEPYRDETNQPNYVELVAEKVAQVKALKLDQVAQETVRTTIKLFDLN
ncbi:MAG: YchF/TatD family DNA exonuclease [Candidatus Moranbacteria bacterium]|nr:YchF/TatD family DNA exonuclease [Candidatus Moranbacteria bacterium]